MPKKGNAAVDKRLLRLLRTSVSGNTQVRENKNERWWWRGAQVDFHKAVVNWLLAPQTVEPLQTQP